MAQPEPGQDEMILVERVFLRIGSAESDEQLEIVLAKFLTPVLLKLTSAQDGVRKKVMEMLVHINKRLKSRPLIKLPIESLLQQYQDATVGAFVRNFTIIYIKMGFPRLEMAKQAELALSLLETLAASPQSHRDSMLPHIARALALGNLTSKQVKLGTTALQQKRPEMLKLLLEFCQDVLLLTYGLSWPLCAAAAPAGGSGSSAVKPPAGMSDMSVRRVVGDSPPPTPEQLELLKCGLVEWLIRSELTINQTLPTLLVAVSDTRFSVANVADLHLRRMLPDVDWEDRELVTLLCSMYLGSLVPKSNNANRPQTETDRAALKSPGSTRFRLKLLPLLSRSKTATTLFPQALQIIFDGLFGTGSNAKLKLQTVLYAGQVVTNTPSERLTPIGGALMGCLQRVLTDEVSATESQLRAAAFVSVGRLGVAVPALVRRDLTIVKALLASVEREDDSAASAAQDALLSLVTSSLRGLEAAERGVLEALLVASAENESVRLRRVLVQCWASLFPPDHTTSKLQLLLATADSRSEVFSEACRHLGLTGPSQPTPQFNGMMDCVMQEVQRRRERKLFFTVANKQLVFQPAAYDMIVRYLSLCLRQSANEAPSSGSSASKKDDEHDQLICGRSAATLSKVLQRPDVCDPLCSFVLLVEQLLSVVQDSSAAAEASLFCLLELVASAPGQLLEKLLDAGRLKLSWLEVLVSSSREVWRRYAAELYGIVATARLDEADFTAKLQHLVEAVLNGKSRLETRHGCTLALAYCLSYRAERQLPPVRTDPHVVGVFSRLVSSSLTDPKQVPMLLEASCLAVGIVGRTGLLPLADGADDQAAPPSVNYVIHKLLNMNTNKLNSKMRELAIESVGLICVGDMEAGQRKKIVEHFLRVSKDLEEFELQLAIGESLVCAVLGSASIQSVNPWLREAGNADSNTNTPGTVDKEQTTESTSLLDWLLEQLLQNQLNVAAEGHPRARQSACVWLLALLKHCQHLQPLRSRLAVLQRCFMSLLSDRSALVQEAAARGLSLVYGAGDADQRTQLVTNLVESLSSGRPSGSGNKAVAVSSPDTAVFGENELGRDPSGGRLSTYREICALASDLNQPDLVYRFMALAQHNAVWNSRRGAAVGFATIAAQIGGDSLSAHAESLVPKLYRYQFDPQSAVQQTMRGIWAALVPEPARAVQRHLVAIFSELLDHLTDPAWRVRESCCLGVSDLLTQVGAVAALSPLLEHFPQLWKTLLRVCDDVKQSVRVVALRCLNTLSGVCVRLCEQQDSPTLAARAMAGTLPALLEAALGEAGSCCDEARAVCLSTVSQLAERAAAGAELRRQLPELVPALLSALSGLEPESLRYLSVRLAGQSDAGRKQRLLDKARVSAVKESSMFRTLMRCVQHVEDEQMAALVSRLSDTMKRNTGLGAKCGVSLFVGRLATERAALMSAHSGRLLMVLLHGMQDRNATVQQSCAAACGAVCRHATSLQLQKLLAKLRSWYLSASESEEGGSTGRQMRAVCASALHSLSRHSLDQLREHTADAASLAYVAMHEQSSANSGEEDDDKNQQEHWQEVWQDLVPGTEGGLRMYFEEILAMCEEMLAGQSWLSKAQAARCLGAAAAALPASGLSGSGLEAALNTLLQALAGRTWTGKENLLNALASVCVHSASSIQHPQRVVELLLREAAKDQLQYKCKALEACGVALEALQVDRFDQMYRLVLLHVQVGSASMSQKKEDSDDEDDRSVRPRIQAIGFKVLGQCWPRGPESDVTQDQFAVLYLTLLKDSWDLCPRTSQSCIIVSLQSVIPRLHQLDPARQTAAAGEEQLVQLLQLIGALLSAALTTHKAPSLRQHSLTAVRTLLQSAADCSVKRPGFPRDAVSEVLKGRLEPALTVSAEDVNPQIQSAAVDLQQMLAIFTQV